MEIEERIIALHGWGSTGEGSGTIRSLISYLPDDIEFICPTLDYTNPHGVAKELLKLAEDNDPTAIIGVSMGGFWARWLANQVGNINLIMLNPALNAYESSKKYMGKNINRVTGDVSYYNDGDRQELLDYEIKKDSSGLAITAIVATNDAIIPPDTVETYIGSDRCAIYYVGGGHRLTGGEWLPHTGRAIYSIACA